MLLRNTNGRTVVAVGLLGAAGYEMLRRASHSAMLSNDMLHGLWLGACIGPEFLGVYRFRGMKRREKS